VGKSSQNVEMRVKEHFTTGGSAFTKKFKPLSQLQPLSQVRVRVRELGFRIRDRCRVWLRVRVRVRARVRVKEHFTTGGSAFTNYNTYPK
jgi:hypothetical protein